jgi:hypothetical protein
LPRVISTISAYTSLSVHKIRAISALHCRTGEVVNDPALQKRRRALRNVDVDVRSFYLKVARAYLVN